MVAAVMGDLFEILERVSLLEPREHAIVERFHRGGDKRAAGVAQPRQQVAVPQQVLDLDRHVVGDAGMRARPTPRRSPSRGGDR